MLQNIDFKDIQHSKFKLHYCLVINTILQQKSIDKNVESELVKITYKIFEHHNKCVVNKISVKNESTIAISFTASPTVQLSKLINNFKTVSSRFIRSNFLNSENRTNSFWEQKYYIYTLSAA